MKLSYNWLKEMVDVDLPPQQLAERILMLGLETTVQPGVVCAWKNVITARVVERNKHPQADKLSLCSVTDGTNTYAVVCGAPNVAAGQTIAFAQLGAELPGGMVIRRAKIRGVESEGMICSEKELGLKETSDGIMVLPENTPLGVPVETLWGDNDTYLEVEITTNRSDCLSHWGVARELGAALGLPVKLPAIAEHQITGSVDIENREPELCKRYIGIRVDGVSVKPSPEWLARKLEKCGLRPINNIVDITNYVLMELGHPLHAFDREKMRDGKVVVRKAAAGEKISALDGKEHALDDTMLVIADGRSPQAIAGVIGGTQSGITAETHSIIIESAVFLPGSIRRTAKKTGIATDSSYRFERGTSWDVAQLASWRALGLVLELAGGTVAGRTDIQSQPPAPLTIELRMERLKRMLGMDIPKDKVRSILSGLGIAITETGSGLSVRVPSWRLDIHQEADLVEEVVRLYGYDSVPTTVMPVLPDINEGKTTVDPLEGVRAKALAAGFNEAVNYSFAEEKDLSFFSLPVAHRIGNPLSKENEVLRSSLLPGLWKNLQLNTGQGYSDIKLFETGTIFSTDGEKRKIAFIATGAALPRWWKQEAFESDFYYMAGFVMLLLAPNRVRLVDAQNPAPYYHPGKTSAIEVNGRAAGTCGVLRPDLNGDIPGEIVYAELDIEMIRACWNRKTPRYEQLRRHPAVKRDISLLCDTAVRFDKIQNIVASYMKNDGLLRDAVLFSRFVDEKKLGAGKVSYSLHLVFRHPDHTLTDDEVSGCIDKIMARLGKELGITLR